MMMNLKYYRQLLTTYNNTKQCNLSLLLYFIPENEQAVQTVARNDDNYKNRQQD